MATYQYNVLTGVIIPDTSTVLTDVENEYKNAFGQDLIVTPDTPQGVLIAAETTSRISVLKNNAAIANQINPSIAGGVYLDAIGMLTLSKRSGNTFSQVIETLAGVAGTFVDVGVTMQDDAGNEWSSITSATLDSGGAGTVTFQAVNPGPIVLTAGQLTQLVTAPLGLETATNAAGTFHVGAVVQGDSQFRLIRNNLLANQATSQSLAIISALYSVQNVTALQYVENFYNTAMTIAGIPMIANSIYVCVQGGTDLDVATAIFNKKGGGCGYTNNISSTPVTVNITDPNTGIVYPVFFDRPNLIPILVQVTVKANSSIQDPTTAVTNAITKYAAGLIDGEPGLNAGTSVSAFELAGAVTSQIPGIFVPLVQITKASPISYSPLTIAIANFELAVIAGIAVIIV